MNIWMDVEDLFFYESLKARPSGIQRLSFEIYSALVGLSKANVKFVRHDRSGSGYRMISWEDVLTLYNGMAHAALETQTSAGSRAVQAFPESGPRFGLLRKAVGLLPPAVRAPLGEAARAQVAALRAGGRFIVASTVSLLPRKPARNRNHGKESSGPLLADVVQSGDVLCIFGAPWVHEDVAKRVAAAKRDTGLRVALLMYDVIPLVRPEFVTPAAEETFRRCYTSLVPLADHIFSISEATTRDIRSWVAQLVGRHPSIVTLPIGTGFSHGLQAIRSGRAPTALPAGLTDRNFVLFVSTIEARKNHDLAFRAWRNLMDEVPRERLPTLVFAGAVGWLVDDLMAKIANSRHLDGKLVVIKSPSDEELAALYRGCRFTIFPSLYEGWGLPVTESLSFGRTCVASNRCSVPEAGQEFCIYIDPDNITSATKTLRRAIEDDILIEFLEKKIKDNFTPIPWHRTASFMLKSLR